MLVKLKTGNSNQALIVINGLNSSPQTNIQAFENAGFYGSIYGIEWNNSFSFWPDLNEMNIKHILSQLTEFAKSYFEVSQNADNAGKELASEITVLKEESVIILAHSMGTRAAYYLLNSSNPKKIEQVILVNGAVLASNLTHNFNSHNYRVNHGIMNMYNPADPVLNILKQLFNKSINGIPILNEFIGVTGIFDPIGLKNVEWISENKNINYLQGESHNLDNIIYLYSI